MKVCFCFWPLLPQIGRSCQARDCFKKWNLQNTLVDSPHRSFNFIPSKSFQDCCNNWSTVLKCHFKAPLPDWSSCMSSCSRLGSTVLQGPTTQILQTVQQNMVGNIWTDLMMMGCILALCSALEFDSSLPKYPVWRTAMISIGEK